MRAIVSAGALLIGLSAQAWAAEGLPAQDRLTLMLSGSALSGSQDVSGVRIGGSDGRGGALGWLHNFSSSSVLGLAAEHQRIDEAHWTFGTLSLAYGSGSAERRSNYYFEGRQGSGKDNAHTFTYGMYTGGLIQNLTRQFAIQIEDKQIEIDTTHGNLPKVGLQYLWNLKLLTSVAYAHSVSSDLGTRLWSARADYYGKQFNFILGGAAGKATPAVTNLQTGITIPGLNTHEAFIGVTRPFKRMEVTLLGDYLKIGNIERGTITLNGTVRLGDTAR
jgi:hypothetical protein